MNPPEHLAEHLVELGRDFHRRGWALGTSGNFSAVIDREPLRVAITASSLDKSRLSLEHILEIGVDGKGLDRAQGRPSAETLLHLAIVVTAGAGRDERSASSTNAFGEDIASAMAEPS